MKIIPLLSLLLLTQCAPECDFKIEYDVTRDNYWIYKCNGSFPILESKMGSFQHKEDAENKVREIRKRILLRPHFTYVE